MHGKAKPTAAESAHMARIDWFKCRFVERSGCVHSTCQFCGRSLWFPPSKHGLYATCGGVCADGLLQRKKAERARLCETCNREFVPRWTQLRSGIGIYCSQACNVKAHMAMNAPDAQVRARESLRRTYASNPFSKCGADHPRWNGGKRAKYERERASGASRLWCSQRRTRGVVGKPSKGFILKLGGLQRWKCAACHKNIRVRYEVDHIVAVSRGGSNADSNLQLLCMPCNRRKHAKDPIDYMQSLGYLL